jgi:PAS domain S-box-containing protein
MSDSNLDTNEAKVPRWYLAYFFLATFDILTVAVGLWLISLISGIFVDSIEINKEWSSRAGNVSELRSLAGQVNAPGNDVFDSRNVDRETRRLHNALNNYLVKKDEILRDIQLNVHGANARLLTDNLSNIQYAMVQMTNEAEQIFGLFRENKPSLAGSRMATMDRQYASVNQAFSTLETSIREIQAANFDAQLAEAETVHKRKVILSGFIVLMILGATLYGHKIYRNVRKDALERQKLIDEAHKNEMMSKNILETAAEVIISIDAVGVISLFNKSAELLLGYNREEVIGQNVSILMPDPFSNEHDNYLRHYIETGEEKVIGIEREVPARHKDGTTIPVNLAVSDTGMEGDFRFTGILRDLRPIYKAKEVAEDLIRQESASRRSTELNEQFLRRVGSDLHDGPAQLIALASLRLEAIRQLVAAIPKIPASKSEDLDIVQYALDDALAEIRSISSGLVLPELEGLTLTEIFTKAASIHGQRTHTNPGLNLGALPAHIGKSTHICLYRLVQEGLNNAERHAPGATCSISAHCTDNTIKVEVSDTGSGFETETVATSSSGLGLPGLRERIESMGGQFEIRSAIGQGTQLIARFPIVDIEETPVIRT